MTAEKAEPALVGRTILVMDDDDDVREMIAAVLRAAGAEVTEARTNAEARLRLEEPNIDVVLLDWHLADGCGSRLLETLSRERPDMAARTAIVTGDLLESTEGEIGGRPVLRKPFRPAELIEMIERILRRLER